MLADYSNKKKSIAVIGLGYVGLPLALEFARKFKVIGFDIKEERVEMMRNKIDPSKELPSESFNNTDITFTSDSEVLKTATFFIVAVPTQFKKKTAKWIFLFSSKTETDRLS